MRTTAGIMVLGVLAWVAAGSHAADKKADLKVETKVEKKADVKVEKKADVKVEKKADVKQCSASCCGTATGTVHETSCPKSCDTCGASVCMGTSMKKSAPCRNQKIVDWLTYRPLQAQCCPKSIQPLPCRQPQLWTFFAHRCCGCSHVGDVDSPCCDAPCGCAATPSCKTCTAPAKKPLLAKFKHKDQFASDVAQPVCHKEVVAPAK